MANGGGLHDGSTTPVRLGSGWCARLRGADVRAEARERAERSDGSVQRRLVLDGEDRARRVLAPRRRGGMVQGVTDHRDETAPARATLLAALLACVGVWPLADAGGTGGRAGAEAPKRLAAAPLAAVLTTDCGVDIDDQWALAHLVLSPELALRAIVTTHASSVGFSSAASARTAADVLARVVPKKAAAIRLLPGADVPLERVDAPRPSVGLDL